MAGSRVSLRTPAGVFLIKRIILKYPRINGVYRIDRLRRAVGLITRAEGMILVKLVVERKHGICILVVANGMKVILLPPHLIQEGMLNKPFIVFRMYVRSEKYTTQIESAFTIIEIELFDGCPVILIFGNKAVVEPEAFPLAPSWYRCAPRLLPQRHTLHPDYELPLPASRYPTKADPVQMRCASCAR